VWQARWHRWIADVARASQMMEHVEAHAGTEGNAQPSPRDTVNEDEKHLQSNRSCCESSLEDEITRSVSDEYPAVAQTITMLVRTLRRTCAERISSKPTFEALLRLYTVHGHMSRLMAAHARSTAKITWCNQLRCINHSHKAASTTSVPVGQCSRR
jgi:hypothetical protein